MVLSARSAGPCSEMPVPGSLSSGLISTISQSIPARASATPRLIPAMPAPTINTLCVAGTGAGLPLSFALPLRRALGQERVEPLAEIAAHIAHQDQVLAV